MNLFVILWVETHERREKPMRPHQTTDTPQADLFRSRLDQIIDMKHPLVQMARLIDWDRLTEDFGETYHPTTGRPGVPMRLMIGLHLVQHMDGLSDEAVCARWLESPYVQYFCGETFFRHKLPADRSSMTNWRKRIGHERLENLLAETLKAAMRGGALRSEDCERVTVDTTVQTKAVAHPSDIHLMIRALERLTDTSRKHGVRLRQSYVRVCKYAATRAGRLLSHGKRKAARREIRYIRVRLGRVIRDIGRKIAGNEELENAFAELLGRADQVRTQGVGGKDRLYAFHAPEVECIGKGKARAKWEFGVKVSVATTNKRCKGGQFVLGAMAVPGNPHDSRTLHDQVAQVERITGAKVKRTYADRGYRSDKVNADPGVFISGQRTGLTPTIKRELRRRSAVEPVIGHMKGDGKLDRNHLKGCEGDAINPLLAAAGHNLRLLARWLRLFLRLFLEWLFFASPIQLQSA